MTRWRWENRKKEEWRKATRQTANGAFVYAAAAQAPTELWQIQQSAQSSPTHRFPADYAPPPTSPPNNAFGVFAFTEIGNRSHP